MDPYIGEIRAFGFNYAPKGWALCQGQILSIRQYTALYSILGTFYGGNGTTTFGLPNLQGSVPVHVGSGSGPGLQAWQLGEVQGTATVTLLTNQMPMHTHSLMAFAGNANTTDPANASLAQGVVQGTRNGSPMYQSAAPNVQMNGMAASLAGGNAGHDNMMPYLTFNYCIAMSGIFPPRS